MTVSPSTLSTSLLLSLLVSLSLSTSVSLSLSTSLSVSLFLWCHSQTTPQSLRSYSLSGVLQHWAEFTCTIMLVVKTEITRVVFLFFVFFKKSNCFRHHIHCKNKHVILYEEVCIWSDLKDFSKRKARTLTSSQHAK